MNRWPPHTLIERASALLQAEAPALPAKIAELAPGNLFSVAFRLTDTPDMAKLDCLADTRWVAPHQEMNLYAAGVAETITEDALGGWPAALAHWPVFGDSTLQPLAFFTLPPATEPTKPALTIPRLLARQDATGLSLILSAKCNGEEAQTLLHRWQQEIRQFLTPNPASRNDISSRACAITPDAETWHERVSAAHRAIDTHQLAKVVLARRLTVKLSQTVDLAAITQRLAEIYPECHVFSLPHRAGHLVAATPEKLAVKRGHKIVCDALAGTSRRSGDREQDERTARQLLASPKERHEHALVVDTIRKRLEAMCTTVEHAEKPSIMALRHVLHLWTVLQGQLRTEVSLLDAATRLHPTPAVLGIPGEAALALLARLGEERDCLYTGVAGWVDRQGDGDAVVILRSAYLEQESAVLWAGAGIVAGSDSASELNEIEMKLATMLEVLGAPYA